MYVYAYTQIQKRYDYVAWTKINEAPNPAEAPLERGQDNEGSKALLIHKLSSLLYNIQSPCCESPTLLSPTQGLTFHK